MTTLAGLLQDCRYLIGDVSTPYVFSELQLTEWINNAIAELNHFFPRRSIYEISTALNDRKYDLPVSAITVLSVEFPKDQDPPVFFMPMEYTHPDFWTKDGHYCFIRRHDATSTNPPELWISNKPAASQVIRVEYFQEHNPLTVGTDTTTILGRHEHLIHMFVRWKAWSELATTEGMDPDPTELLAATVEVNAGRAEKSYRSSLKEAHQAESETGQAHLWMDKWDRIY